MADISGKAYEQAFANLVSQVGAARMRAAESARAVGQERRLSEQLVEGAKQFQQQERRQYQTDIARILADLYGTQYGYMAAGLRAQYHPELLISEYQRLGDSKKRTSEEINEVIKSPISNERYGIEVAGLNNLLESLDFRDNATYTQFNQLIEGLKTKYEVAPLGRAKKIVLEDKKLGGFGIVEKSVKLWSSIGGNAPQLKKARAILKLEGEQAIILNDDVSLLKRKATVKDVFTKLLFSKDVIKGNIDILAQSAGYENAQALINNFANEWCEDDTRKGNAVQTMQGILNANGLYVYAGGAVRPDEWNLSEKLRNRVKLSAVQAGIQANIPGYFPPPEKTLDKEVVDSLLNKIDKRKKQGEIPPEEYTLPMVESLISDEIPNFVNETQKNKVQKAFSDSINGKVQRILNNEVNIKIATKELMEYLKERIVPEDFDMTAYPFIKESQYRTIYKMLIRETGGKAKLANDEEQDLKLK